MMMTEYLTETISGEGGSLFWLMVSVHSDHHIREIVVEQSHSCQVRKQVKRRHGAQLAPLFPFLSLAGPTP